MTNQSKALNDLDFTTTMLYKKYRQFFVSLDQVVLPKNVCSQLCPGMTYPIKFTPVSPVYFFRVISLAVSGDKTQSPVVSCHVFIRQNQYRGHSKKRVVGLNQLLCSSRKFLIALNVLVGLIIQSEKSCWGVLSGLNERTCLIPISLHIMTLTQFNGYCAYSKCKSSNLPFRRLPESLSFPHFADTNVDVLTSSHSINDFVASRAYVSYCRGHFNLNSSFNNIRNHAPLNGAVKMELDTAHNFHGIPSAYVNGPPTENKKARRRRGRPILKRDAIDMLVIPEEGEHSSKTSKEQMAGDVELKEEPGQAPERILRKRNRTTSDVNEQKRSKIQRSGRVKTEQERVSDMSADENEKMNESSVDDGCQPRRSSRRIAGHNIKKESTEATAPSASVAAASGNEDISANSTGSVSDAPRKIGKVVSFKKKSSQILSKWANETEFMEEYTSFYAKHNNSQQPRVPKMGWLSVNVFKLFKNTVNKGGYEEVTRKLLWKDVYKSLNNQTIVSNAATTIRSHYRKLLLQFENHLFKDSDEAVPGSEPHDNLLNMDKDSSGNPKALTGEDGGKEGFNTMKLKDFRMDTIFSLPLSESGKEKAQPNKAIKQEQEPGTHSAADNCLTTNDDPATDEPANTNTGHSQWNDAPSSDKRIAHRESGFYNYFQLDAYAPPSQRLQTHTRYNSNDDFSFRNYSPYHHENFSHMPPIPLPPPPHHPFGYHPPFPPNFPHSYAPPGYPPYPPFDHVARPGFVVEGYQCFNHQYPPRCLFHPPPPP